VLGGLTCHPSGKSFCTAASGALNAKIVRTEASMATSFSAADASSAEAAKAIGVIAPAMLRVV
jgi:hypothetical protein